MGFLLSLFTPVGEQNENSLQGLGVMLGIFTFLALLAIPFYLSGFISFILEIFVFFVGFSFTAKLIVPNK